MLAVVAVQGALLGLYQLVEKIEDDLAATWLTELLEDHVLEDVLICTYLNEVRFTDTFVREKLEAPLGIERPPEEENDSSEEASG